jgi:hypothetical protein
MSAHATRVGSAISLAIDSDFSCRMASAKSGLDAWSRLPRHPVAWWYRFSRKPKDMGPVDIFSLKRIMDTNIRNACIVAGVCWFMTRDIQTAAIVGAVSFAATMV